VATVLQYRHDGRDEMVDAEQFSQHDHEDWELV
jgi:hypothetical protein